MKYILSLVLLFSHSAFAKKTERTEITISGMACASCEGKVRNALIEYKGVEFVSVSSETGKAVVLVDEGVNIATEEFKNFLKEKSGFSATSFAKTETKKN